MTPILSFWPSVYDKILKQEKILEYRRRFPKNCTYAYMYITKPVQAIVAIIYFKQMHSLMDWLKIYAEDHITTTRIKKFLQKYHYAMEIESIQKIQPITLDMLRKNIPNFTAPQSYILLENNISLKYYIEKNTISVGNRIYNKHYNIYPNHICKEY